MNEEKKKKFIEAFSDLVSDCKYELYKHKTTVDTDNKTMMFKLTFNEFGVREIPLMFQFAQMFENVFYKLYKEKRIDM